MDMRYGKDCRPGFGNEIRYRDFTYSGAFRKALWDGIKRSPRHPDFYTRKDEDYVHVLRVEDAVPLTDEGDGYGVEIVFRTVCVTPCDTRVANRMTRAAASRA